MKTKKSFSVKMFFEIKGIGKVVGKKPINNCKMIEERIILVQASDFDDALKKAEKEAVKYEKYTYTSKFGQEITTKLISIVDAFEVYDIENLEAELYSNTTLIDKKVNSKKFVKSLCLSDKLDNKHNREYFLSK